MTESSVAAEQDLELGGETEGLPGLVPLHEPGTTTTASSASSSLTSLQENDTIDGSSQQHVPHNNLRFRRIQPGDQEAVQRLHEEWFPVVYQDEFYDDLVNERLAGEPLFTCVAVRPGSSDSTMAASQHDDTSEPDHNSSSHQQQHETLPQSPQQQQPQSDEQIVACVVGSFVPATRLSAETQALLVPNPQRHDRLFYIMTLGTVVPFRQAGLATRLVQKCIHLVEQEPSCGALYLHVITFNHAAICFYERLGFSRVCEIPHYYTIHGRAYNCYLYAKYFHGNRGHQSLSSYWKNLVSSALTVLWRQLSNSFNLSSLLLESASSSSSSSQEKNEYGSTNSLCEETETRV